MDPNILYEDNHILVVIKPAGVLSQEDITKDPDMVSILKQYLKVKYNKPGNVYCGLVQRLDRMTEGIMVFAKTSKASSRLSEMIRKHDFSKTYLAVVEGTFSGNGKMVDTLLKDTTNNKVFINPNGKLSSLSYECCGSLENFTLVKIHLETGRSHQIRVQMSSRNHPIYGDVLYGGQKGDLALVCSELSFEHPVTHIPLDFTYVPTKYPFSKFLKK